jgi:hypothetical protein
MKILNSKTMIRTSATALSLVLCLFLADTATLWAETGDGVGQAEAFDPIVYGPFDGLDLKTRRVWINDTVYLLDSRVKVKGTHKKLGLITDLKQGETIRATLRPNEDQPIIPYVILIERQ